MSMGACGCGCVSIFFFLNPVSVCRSFVRHWDTYRHLSRFDKWHVVPKDKQVCCLLRISLT